MRNITSAFAIGPCVLLQSHLIQPATNEKFGNGDYSVVVLVENNDAQILQVVCEELIERAFPQYTPAQKTQLRIPGDYDEPSGRIRFRLKLKPVFGKPEVCDMD